VILLAAPLELFFQQIVMYPAVWVSVSPAPTIARKTFYSLSDPFVYVNETKGLIPDPYLSSVITPFFYSDPVIPDVQFSCPTANCTWESFDTLSVCSACSENVTHLLDFGCYESPGDWLNNVTLTYNSTDYPTITSCGYWLNASSDSRILMTGYALNPLTHEPDVALGMRLFPLVDVFSRLPYYGGTVNFQNVTNPLLDVLIVGTPSPGDVYSNSTPVAHECVLSWCTQSLQSTFWWGHIEQTVFQSFQNTTNTGYPWITKVSAEGIPIYGYNHNVTITPPDQDQSDGQEPRVNVTYGMESIYAEATIFALDPVAPSFLTIQNASDPGPLFKYSTRNPPTESRYMTNNPWLPPNDVSQHMNNLATAITVAVRNTQDSNGTYEMVSGAAWDTRIHVQIRWEWITLPLVLLTAALVFLLATVIRSSKEVQDVGIWKTSALAILFNGLGEDVQRSVGPGCRMGDARAKARELMVKLLPD